MTWVGQILRLPAGVWARIALSPARRADYCILPMPFNSYRSELLVTQLAIDQLLRDDIDGTGASEAGIGIDPGLLAASIRGRPDQALEHAKEVVVDAIQVTLGEVLLVLVSIAVVLLVIILVLFEADLILKLGGKLGRRLGPGGSDPTGSKLPAKARPRPNANGKSKGAADA